jgi:SAM-dependent methyltransferase
MKSRPFSGIAPYYDTLMADVDYEDWVEYIAELYPDYGKRRLRILDMACGTGICSLLYNRAGHEVVALDSSPEMLEVARSRFSSEGVSVQIIQDDMRRFQLEDKVDMVTCLFDSLNNITVESDLASCLSSVLEALVDSGVFVFDINTEYGLSTFWGDKTVVKEDGRILSIWRNKWNSERKLAVLNLTLFVREGDVYRRIDEVHEEKGYTGRQVSSVLQAAGFREISMFRHLTTERPSSVTGRIMFRARK